MARYTDANCKLCRRERTKLFLKGDKCFTDKCPLEKRNYPPGQHGNSRRSRMTDYAVQLREKQKVKKTYGILEKQFRKYFAEATRRRGVTGDNLIGILESRLDNTIYRLGLALSRKAARQLILHRHITVNGKIVNIPSYLLKAGDVIKIRERSKKIEVFHEAMKRMKDNMLMPWLSLDKANMSGTYLNEPDRADVPFIGNEQLIVELYSK
ncbi:MAG: 30S ribosomal protein S4 [Ignavibacteriaceae bacterium]|nr:MAG: 30S ribosomal protein S4 [Chlorobiota bacterium]KXK06155.1 MAG: 30S ribosomal protein S4 [Chlorobi bacterium OLB4]MBV6398583.1 30S ribosomal protein S4 [Ignavibacteria bacterium]MCC6885817.1 30S ribosomal protein S4 [Ignavibacteriales bacterium]MCE7952988.1 30S ribosomal protein S4 [Chlorobi bacterium CHB7]MDL1887174.1 30S ribosomal protein S4 [Ignavibacteria bacterium CHB1]MEB2329228.1 30S ribosomal protein S4 [Ignavibacteriaceae bacterium]OQY78067.1 MAG: 30S ribosomal protein S4 [I